MSMKLIGTVTVGAGGAASIAFNGIPSTETDLFIVINCRSDRGLFQFNAINLRLNNDSTGIYSFIRIRGNGASASGNSYSSQSQIELSNVNELAGATTTFSQGYAYIRNYSNSANKTILSDFVSEDNATTSYQTMTTGLYENTSVISSVQLFMAAGNIAENSTASLYTINKVAGA